MSDKRKFGRGDKKTDDEVILNKHILKKGTGQDKPFKGCKVLYRYISRRDANDSSLGSSIPCAPEVLKLEGLSTYNALENCLTSMRKGEKSLFTLSTLDFKSGILERFLEVSAALRSFLLSYLNFIIIHHPKTKLSYYKKQIINKNFSKNVVGID